MLSSRLDPPLSLGTLRSAGRLRELRADRLRFSADEAGAILEQQGLRLTPTQTRELHACTRGWPTGVRLAGAVLYAGADPDAFLARFASDSRPVADFLVGEVLSSLPDGDRELLSTAAADDPLADGTEARDGLERLARTTGLVTPVHEPVHGYRVDPLVAAYLRTERGHRSRSTEGPHGRAAGSGQGEEDAAAALQRAVGGSDDALLVESVRRFAGTLLVTGQHPVLRDALSRLHERSAPDDPWLALCSALTHVEAGDPVAAQADLDSAARLWPTEPDDRLEILRSVTELFAAAATADLTAAPTRIRAGRARASPRSGRHWPSWPPEVWRCWWTRTGRGRRPRCRRRWTSRAVRVRLSGDAVRRPARAARGMAGDHRGMTAAAEEALVTAVAGWVGRVAVVDSRSLDARVRRTAAVPSPPRRAMSPRRPCTGDNGAQPRLEFALHIVHGAALFDGGSRHRGLQEMQQARTDLGAVSLAGEQAAALAVLEHRAALALGRPDIARAVADWLSERSGAGGEVLLMRAWAALWTGRDQAARSAVRPLLDGSVTGLLPHTVVEALLVETTAGVTAGEVQGARRALRSRTVPGRAPRRHPPVRDGRTPARALLGHHLGRGRTTEPFVARALAAGRGAHPTQRSRSPTPNCDDQAPAVTAVGGPDRRRTRHRRQRGSTRHVAHGLPQARREQSAHRGGRRLRAQTASLTSGPPGRELSPPNQTSARSTAARP